MSRCYYCAERLGAFSDKYNVREAVKPKGCSRRWKVIGQMCERCESAGLKASFDKFKAKANA